MRSSSFWTPVVLVAATISLLGACTDEPIAAPASPPDTAHVAHGDRVLGLVSITLSGIGTSDMHATASGAPQGAPLRSLAATEAGANLAMTTLPSTDGSIELDPVSTGSFTEGQRGNGGQRYMSATFRVRNAQMDSTPYPDQRTNLTFLAVETPSTINQTAIADMGRFGGGPADPSLALAVLPTGHVFRGNDGQIASAGADVLQVLTETEAASFTAPSGVTSVLPYGFVVRNPSTPNSRTLPANPGGSEFDGVVTFAFRIPLQASASDDPFTVTAMFLAVDDGDTRVTQSREEQTMAGSAASEARAVALGGTLTALPGAIGSVFPGAAGRSVCAVRTAGPTGSPTASLVDLHLTALDFGTDVPSAFPLSLGGGRSVTAIPSGAGFAAIPVVLSNTNPASVAAPESVGPGWLLRATRTPGTATVTASACEIGSAPLDVRVTNIVSMAGGEQHSLAIRADSTVVAWGRNSNGETDVPAGLSGVVAVAAASFHSLALKADGTVVAWGDDGLGQSDVPPGLTNVVAIAASEGQSMALKSDGTVVLWGDNGNLGTEMSGLSDVAAIAITGEGFNAVGSMVLKADGTVVGFGVFGDPLSTDFVVPAGLTDVTAIAMGPYGCCMYGLALKADGTVTAWGDDQFGETDVPPGLTNVVAISAGGEHVLALKADSTVVAWGGTDFTDGGQTDVPPGLSGVVAIAAGGGHSFALKADGTVVAWGFNQNGQINVPAGLLGLIP